MDIQLPICHRENGVGKVVKIKSGKFRPLCGHTPIAPASRTPMGRAFKMRSRTDFTSVEELQSRMVTFFEQEAFCIERRHRTHDRT
jgi:hypothetical protein